MTPQEVQQIRKLLTLVQKSEREVRRASTDLAQADDLSSARYKQISDASKLLIENREQIEEFLLNISDTNPSPILCSQSPSSRGREKQSYLIDNSQREAYIATLQKYFEQYYNALTRCFRLPDGSTVKPQIFLACVYDIGIKDGLALEGATVKDFSDMAKEAASVAGVDFRTAYNTIQHVTRHWRDFAGKRACYKGAIHLYSLKEEEVPEQYLSEYWEAMMVYNQVGRL